MYSLRKKWGVIVQKIKKIKKYLKIIGVIKNILLILQKKLLWQN